MKEGGCLQSRDPVPDDHDTTWCAPCMPPGPAVRCWAGLQPEQWDHANTTAAVVSTTPECCCCPHYKSVFGRVKITPDNDGVAPNYK